MAFTVIMRLQARLIYSDVICCHFECCCFSRVVVMVVVVVVVVVLVLVLVEVENLIQTGDA